MTTSSGITRSKVCVKCGTDKLIDAFGNDSRTPDGYAKTCRDCRGTKPATKPATKPKGNGKAKAEEPADTGLVDGPALSIAPGLGLDAWIENGCLQLSQGEDAVALSKTEARVLFAQFHEWAS